MAKLNLIPEPRILRRGRGRFELKEPCAIVLAKGIGDTLPGELVASCLSETSGIEANVMQSLFADLVTDAAKRRMKRIAFIAVTQPTKIDKDFRIRTTLEPVIADGRLFMQESHIELVSELRSFPTGLTKDLVDCLASAISLVPRRPLPQQQNEEAEQLASYLRNTGAPTWYIQKRVKEVLDAQISL